MNLTGGACCANNNKAIRSSTGIRYRPVEKQSEIVTDFTVANTKDLDRLARGKDLVDPEEATALDSLFRCLQLRKRARRAAPGGVFCMSGPVAHVDEEEEEDDSEFLYIFPESINGSHHNPSERTIKGEKAMPNGDMYVGAWNRSLPEGRGKYLWADGCMYEGQWCRGKKTGKGKISWPSGATYEGDFMGGYLHGYGTFTGIDGSTYRGQWLLNDKHGYGHKCYKNGDLYEGSWKHGVQEGRGRYIWENGNEYIGEWRGGLMCGIGIMSRSNGDKYDGQWLDGLEHGHGVHKWADGSCYMGTWSKGLKDGKGTFYPSCGNQTRLCHLLESSPSSLDQHDDLSDDGQPCWKERSSSMSDFEVYLNAPYAPSSETSSKTLEPRIGRTLSFDGVRSSSSEEFDDNDEGSSTCDTDNFPVQSAVEREYVQGVLINEVSRINVPSKAAKRGHKRQPKEWKRPGEIIYKGHRNYDLMLNLQLGIRYAVGKITPISKREIVPVDFDPKGSIWMRFPPEGSACTPPHHSVDFKWKDYCPMVFRHLRELFKIDAADYMLSICGNDALRELSSPGKSGSVFYLSHDDQFMIKTMRKSEVKVLLRMLPNYYNHVRTYESTLITKFFGLHSIRAAGGQKVQLIVMGNMFCSELHIHRRFDLKGSSLGRSTDKVEIDETTTLKDLDLEFMFQLEPSWRQALLKQIKRDCNFLEAERIMDYSLLLGLHLRAPQYSTPFSPKNSSTDTHLSSDETFKAPTSDELGVQVENTDLVLPGTARLGIRLGVNMPARAIRRTPKIAQDSHPEGDLFGEDYDAVLYFGIIDILQDYDISKRLEHAYKSLQFDSHSISAVDPKLYSKRFQDFICRTFPGNS